MKFSTRAPFAAILAVLLFVEQGRAAQVLTEVANGVLRVQFEGDDDNDWWLQSSTDLVNWITLTNFGTLLAGEVINAPGRTAGTVSGVRQFFRGQKSDGLFDPALFRTIDLTFPQANWQTLLVAARAAGTNVLCSLLTLDNGATNVGVGARYKGYTSFIYSGTKKSINLELDWLDPLAELMDSDTINLNNAFGDETLLREPLYFEVMRQYAACPRGSLAQVNVNGALWGVFALIQQQDGRFIREWFPDDTGDRWRTVNAAGGLNGYGSDAAALAYLGNSIISSYEPYYDLRTTNSPNPTAWSRLINATYVLNRTPFGELRDKVEDVLAVDDWLWFLAVENIFVDDDSYWKKGADYSLYYEPVSGRFHPIEHDGNETLAASIDVTLSPVQGSTGGNRPVLERLLAIPELRQRYLAHLRTVLQEGYHPALLTPRIDHFSARSAAAIAADPNRGFPMTSYYSELNALKTFVANRYRFLTNHAELRPVPPVIVAVNGPAPRPTATQIPFVTAQVVPAGNNGIDSVWLYYRDRSVGRFAVSRMHDDGVHGDGAANDSVFGGATTNFPAGDKVHYYIEARSANAARAASFHPPRAERDTHAYFVAVTTAPTTPVVINEVMASNTSTLADPQGEFDDWIELRNLTSQAVDLTGRHLSDEPNNPRKWPFPAGTTIPANGYLLVWADEDGLAPTGLHANFKLGATGETIYLTDTDANFNAVLDTVIFGVQQTDLSFGRTAANPDQFVIMLPTPGQPNP